MHMTRKTLKYFNLSVFVLIGLALFAQPEGQVVEGVAAVVARISSLNLKSTSSMKHLRGRLRPVRI